MQYVVCGLKNLGQNLPVSRIVELCEPVRGEPSFVARNRQIGHIIKLFEGITDNMDVVNVSKGNSTVRVVTVQATVFISSTGELICTCIEKWSSIVDFNKAS